MTRRKKAPHPALDLFGEVPVTWDEVYLWVESVAGIPRDSWRFKWYFQGWNVPEKIRAAKLSGTFDESVAQSYTSPRWPTLTTRTSTSSSTISQIRR
jgi:hypothetical protein